ncbi:glycerophosphodiester phosphodiesterase 1-like [Hydractinia symbiolongicarpus]|uniref:glycerophosphodiester phosphodiesterase 1-like n=1 Tax=Hydractinia symbiolongicarpus TaxID=13093 RepID=UPI002550CB89|nr:glycerophosphodiester phosphodiesterase 1-like [Hydractinia symbiolongicarpus]
MSFIAYFGVVPIITIAIVYKFFKLPKQDLSLIQSMVFRDNKPIIIGHRGGGFEGPENTLIAIENSYKNGATAVEVDLDFTKDGVPIIFHDDSIDRVTNATGKVNQMLYEDMKNVNAAAKFNYTLTKDGKSNIEFEKIPTLTEVVELCMKYNLLIDLDVKGNPHKTAFALKELLQTVPNAPNFVLVTSFFPGVIYQIRKQCPQYQTGLIWRYHFMAREISGRPRFSWYITPFLDICDKLAEVLIHTYLPDFLGVSVVAMQKDHLSKRYINKWRENGIEVVAWTVNNPLEKQYLLENLGVPIITDSLLNSENCQEQNV